MFNLLIRGDLSSSAWPESGTYSLERKRVFEYSDGEAVSVYSDNIQSRKELPCLFSCEGLYGYGRVGRISSIVDRGHIVNIAYSSDPRFPPIPIHDEETYEKFGCVRSERYRTHWAIKNIDLFETVAELLASKVPEVTISQTMMDELWGVGSRHDARVFLSHRAKDRKAVSKVAKGLLMRRVGSGCKMRWTALAGWDKPMNRFHIIPVRPCANSPRMKLCPPPAADIWHSKPNAWHYNTGTASTATAE